jgi:hypothetical protein
MAIEGIINTASSLNTIQDSIPDSLKAKGTAKLSQIITTQSNKVASLMLPLALKYAQELGIDPTNLSVPDLCPSEDTLNTILPPLNGLIDDLNQVGDLLTNINKVVGSVAVGGQILQTTADIINNVLPGLQAAIIAIPPPGLPGAVVGAVDVLDYVNKKLLFKKDGTPALPPINAAIGSAAVNLAVASGFILLVTNLLETIIALLKQCFPDAAINTVNPSVLSLASSAKPKDQVNSLQGYKGFNLEIVEVPYNDKLTQRKAVARNQSGEIILQTDLSFTTENSTLITELKSIIDQSGLTGNVTDNPTVSTVEPSILLGTGSKNSQDVKKAIIEDRIRKVQEPLDFAKKELNQAVDRFLKQQKLNAYLREPIPNYLLPITSLNYNTNANLVQSFANEVGFKKSQLDPNVSGTAIKTVERNVPILLNLFKQIKPILDNITPLENSLRNLKLDLDILEGRVMVEKIDVSNLNNQVAIVAAVV